MFGYSYLIQSLLKLWCCGISFAMICGLSHLGMTHGWVVFVGYGFQIWRVAVNILNKKSQTADKGWSTSLGNGRGVNNSLP
jgi:hypothetical protein